MSEYINKGMKLLEYAVIGITIPIVSYLGVLNIVCLTHEIGKKIKSGGELEKVISQESIKLGLDPAKIDVKCNSIMDCASKNEERYELHLKKDSSTMATIRHELYHILKDCDKKKISIPYYLFIAEPRALLYGAFKLKL